MLTIKSIEDFLGNKNIAVIGASSHKKKFGYIILDHLLKRGFNAVPVNPTAGEILGLKCFSDVESLPSEFKAVVFVSKPNVTESVTRQICAGTKIEYLWYQQGAVNKETIDIAMSAGKKVIHGECILMFTKPSGLPHDVHIFFKKVFGKYPK
jgi:uncharacterized protein